MSELPPAIVENARPPFHQRAGFRKAVVVVAIAGMCFAGWKLLKSATRSESNKQLEARQDRARKTIGHGLDALFEHQLDHDSPSVHLVAKLEVAPGLGGGYSDSACGYGLDDAFKEALGEDVVRFSTFSLPSDSDPQIEITAKITPSGRGFQLPNSNKVYPGIAMTADIKFLGKDVHAEVQPGTDIQFKHVTFGIDFSGISETEVAGGILQGTCKQAGYVLLETLTTWKRPGPPPPADPVKECERGFHCRDNAEELEEADPATAAKLYAKACDNDDDDACVRAADLEIELSKGIDEHSARAHMTLEMACHRELVGACAAAGRIRLRPLEPGQPVSSSQRLEALVYYLRACDLGDQDSCVAAMPLVKGTPFAEAAPILAGTRSVTSKTLGTIFALRWGQWTKFDRGQPTVWVTKPPAKLSEDALVTPFEAAKVPAGIVAPAGAGTVYAVAFDKGHGGIDDRCTYCMPSGRPDGPFAMRPTDCICALAPKKH